MSKKQSGKNLKLAVFFVLFVLLLIILSVLFKFVAVLKDSKFDGSHRFVVAFISESTENVVSFSPQADSIYSLKIDIKVKANSLSSFLEVPVDGIIYIGSKNINDKSIPGELLESASPFGDNLTGMTKIDAFRLFLFARSVPSTSIYDEELLSGLNDAQKSSLISLTFTDPTISQENESIQIINSTNVYGLGSRLATFVSNLGGNVILVTTASALSNKSKILYSGNKSYTVKKLSVYFGIPAVKVDRQGVADVIIDIGQDNAESTKF